MLKWLQWTPLVAAIFLVAACDSGANKNEHQNNKASSQSEQTAPAKGETEQQPLSDTVKDTMQKAEDSAKSALDSAQEKTEKAAKDVKDAFSQEKSKTDQNGQTDHHSDSAQ